ncbi:S9 family peptidase [Cellulomonas soli]|uniref:Dipeptidyl aminopeptidase n=1 Tax=Cellulomonas soli TaxID=931535 RepID=A0A512PBW0_9CELL|nr:S9 family peptidase [Cellulomonas soli]NYI60983.1 dipeptidyl aminopeptidase/acylaminoacyl peptidase [Cellulomonas soli]GEP68602.1 dipeptidyl aminopeptidase [Cellulomonas soli]
MIPSDLTHLHVPGTAALLPDGSGAVVSVTHPDLEADQYVGQLWFVPTGPADGPPRRLTRGHRDTAPSISSDGRWVAFLRSPRRGVPQVHLVEVTGGEPFAVTDAPLGAAAARFSPDGARIAYLARVPEDGRYVKDGDPAAEPPRLLTAPKYRSDGIGFVRDRRQHVFVLDVPVEGPAVAAGAGVPEALALTAGDLDIADLRWMPDGTHLVVTAAVHDGRERDLRQDAVLVDARPEGEPSAPRPLTDAGTGSTLDVTTAVPTADGSALWMLAADTGPDGLDFVAQLTGLYRLELTGSGDAGPRRLTDAQTEDLAPGILVPTGDGVLVARLERGAQHLVLIGADGSQSTVLGGQHVVSGVSVAGDAVVATAAGPLSSGDLFAVDVAGRREQLTDLSAPLRATGRVQAPRELEATSADGYPVHGWVVVPDAARHGAGPHPTILMIHGGPFAQYTHALFDEVQVLAEAGYAVVLGNPRGSAGYGRAHGKAIHRAFGTVDTDDVLALLDAALEDPALDADRVGVMGGSYGGYLTAWLTTRTHRFAAAIVERGFLDPVSFVGSSDIGWFFGLDYLGDHGDAAGASAVAAQSPMAHVGQVRTPTLVIHSEQDWRCPVEQGQRWFVELQRRGVESELLLFPGEGHELTRSGRPKHREARFAHVLDWWFRHLPVGA